MQRRWSFRIALAALGAALAGPGPLASAQEPEASAPDVPLEKLFQLPESIAKTTAPEPRRGGRTRAEWRTRFDEARADVEGARREVEDSRKELEEVAPDQAWSMTAPGLPVKSSASETSIDFRLRQQIRRQRDELERAEHRLQELSVEANLAGVPDDWRGPDAEAEPTATR